MKQPVEKLKMEVASRGLPGAKYFIVFSHPLKADLAEGKFGHAGENVEELHRALKIAGIDIEDCYFTGMVLSLIHI